MHVHVYIFMMKYISRVKDSCYMLHYPMSGVIGRVYHLFGQMFINVICQTCSSGIGPWKPSRFIEHNIMNSQSQCLYLYVWNVNHRILIAPYRWMTFSTMFSHNEFIINYVKGFKAFLIVENCQLDRLLTHWANHGWEIYYVFTIIFSINLHLLRI